MRHSEATDLAGQMGSERGFGSDGDARGPDLSPHPPGRGLDEVYARCDISSSAGTRTGVTCLAPARTRPADYACRHTLTAENNRSATSSGTSTTSGTTPSSSPPTTEPVTDPAAIAATNRLLEAKTAKAWSRL